MTSPTTPPSIEQGVSAMVDDVKKAVCRTYEDCEQCVRESPGKCILLAVAAGYCLHRLPIRSLLVAQVRLMAALAPPTLVAFGAAKLCEFLQNEARQKTAPRPLAAMDPPAFTGTQG